MVIDSTTIVILLLLVILAFLILFIFLLLDHRRNPEKMTFLEAGNAIDPTTSEEEAPISIHETCKTGNMRDLNQWLSLSIDLIKRMRTDMPRFIMPANTDTRM